MKTKEEKVKKITANEIRRKLRKLWRELHRYVGINNLTNEYRIKITYLLMWMRLIPVDKNILRGWSLPDDFTIITFRYLGKQKIKEEKNEN